MLLDEFHVKRLQEALRHFGKGLGQNPELIKIVEKFSSHFVGSDPMWFQTFFGLS